jgi:hypothetical protein
MLSWTTYRGYRRNWARIQLGKGWNGFFSWGLQAAHRARGSGFGANVAIVPRPGRWARLSGGAGELLRRFGGITGKAPRRLSAARLVGLIAALGTTGNYETARLLRGARP